MNLIKLQPSGDWHLWTNGNMWPICGAGKPWKEHPEYPEFIESRRLEYGGYDRIRKFCNECMAKHKGCEVNELDEQNSVKLLKASASVARSIRHLSDKDKANVLQVIKDLHQLK